jgi:predicted dehydrogenase
MEPVRFGIIGCGDAAAFHVLAFKNLPDPPVRFIAAHDVNGRSLERFAKRNALTPCGSLEELLGSGIEAVLISAPHYLHAGLTEASAAAGKHVLCEKPMAPTLEECDRMIAASRKAGVTLMVAENHVFLPAHRLIKDLLDRGIIGDVFLARTYEGAFVGKNQFLDKDSWQFTFDRGGGGVVADQGVHKFTFLNQLLGEVESAQCRLGKAIPSPSNKGEDTALILLRYRNGAMAEVAVSSATVHPLNNSTELHGTQGTILEDHSQDNPVRVFSSHAAAEKKGEYYSPAVEHGPYPKYYLIAAREEDAYFARCIRSGSAPDFTPEHAREGVAVVLLSYLSAIKGRTITMEELREAARTGGTRAIIDAAAGAIQPNYQGMKWM